MKLLDKSKYVGFIYNDEYYLNFICMNWMTISFYSLFLAFAIMISYNFLFYFHRNGSIYTHSDIFFQDVEPLRDPSVFVSTLRDSSSPITYKSIKAVRFGDNIVDYNSIHVDLSFITVDRYPEKPTLKGETGEKLVC